MKLLFTITYFTPYVSGLTLYVKRLARELSEDHQVTVLTNQHKSDLQLEEKIEKVRVVRAKPILQISKGYISFDFVIKSLSEVKSSDIIFVNLPQFEGLVPAVMGRILGKRVISIYHCEVVLPKGLFNKLAEFCLNLSNFLTLLVSNKIITYTQDFADESKLLSAFGHKLQTNYPPIDVPKVVKGVQNVIRRKIGQNADFLIGVAARLSAEKGIEYLLEAIPLIESGIRNQELGTNKKKSFKILIAGSMTPVGEEKYKRKILNLVEKYKDYVVFLGELKEEDMGSFYSLLHALVLPSVNSTEAFGMVQVEAMFIGVPVVVTNLAGVRVPVKRTGMGKIVSPRNPDELAEAIADIINNKNNYVKKESFIRNEFSIEDTVSFYEGLIAN